MKIVPRLEVSLFLVFFPTFLIFFNFISAFCIYIIRDDNQTVGCSIPSHPTKTFIEVILLVFSEFICIFY